MRSTRHRPATKAELVRTRRELRVTREARELLVRKRDQLMAAALVELRKARDVRADLTPRWERLLTQWAEARSAQSTPLLGALALEVPAYAPLQGQPRRWMAVQLPEFTAPESIPDPLGGLREVDLRVEQVRGALNRLLPDLIRLMNLETAVRRLTQALRQCHRQVNALDEVIIPELERERRRIEQRLEEKERESIYHIKMLKGRAL